MKRVLVTGAGGFIGSKVVKVLAKSGWKVRATYRNRMPKGKDIEHIVVKDIYSFSDWAKIMKGVDAVVHLAALVHAEEEGDHSREEYFNINVTATGVIARAAGQAGVKRFLFMSTVKALGEGTLDIKPFSNATDPAPEDVYGESKLEAEKLLREIEKECGLEVVILRPPLVYGVGVTANMARLIESVKKWPIFPVASVLNSRSLIYIDNLVDAVKVCLEKPEAAGCTFFIKDERDVSTLDLVSLIADSCKNRTIILKLPKILLLWVGVVFDFIQKLLGISMPANSESISKLFCSLTVDSSEITKTLGWRPPYTLEEGLRATVADKTGAKSGLPFRYWLSAYDHLAVLLAWFLVSLVNYNFFMTHGGATWFGVSLLVVLIAQYVVFQLVGLGWSAQDSRRSCKVSDALRISLVGVIIAGVALFVVNRLEGTPRTSLVLYPFILTGLLVFSRMWFSKTRLGQASKTDIRNDDIIEMTAPRVTNITPSYLQAVSDRNTAVIASVIIVNYNAGELLTECVRSVLASDVPVEVIVSDNGSKDGSINYLRKMAEGDLRLQIIENGANLGFAKANNKVLPYAVGKYLLFLNPDCIIDPHTIKNMAQLMDEHENIGMSGCLIKNLDGSEQAGCRRRVPTPWRSFVRVMGLNKVFPNHYRFQEFSLHTQPLPSDPISVEALSGAFMFARREALEHVGPMDDKYFMHCEDLDWCMRFRHLGWDIKFNPNIEITHVKGTSSRERLFFVLWHKHKGMVRFYNKFFRHQYPMILMWAVVISVWMRFILLSIAILFQRSFAKIEDHDMC